MIERYGVFEDHPRVCGEQKDLGEVDGSNTGSPPRVRGTGDDARVNSIFNRITPACAGNSHIFYIQLYTDWDHPRVCGEQLCCLHFVHLILGSPPRVRGTVLHTSISALCFRITPACAGNSGFPA